MTGFTDIHSHFVYGLDDGAKTKEDMEKMLDAAHEDGVAYLFATPHVTPGIVPFNYKLYQTHFEEARQYCQQKHYDMELHSGGEIMYTPAVERYVLDHKLPTLANSSYVLMEFVPDIQFVELEQALQLMERAGYRTIIAHVERYACMYHGNARKLKERYDVLYQMNASTLLRKHGLLKDRAIAKWMKDELIDYIASDSHDTQQRPSRMKEAYAAVCKRKNQQYADLLFGRNTPSASAAQ